MISTIKTRCFIAWLVIFLNLSQVMADERPREFDIPSQALDVALLIFSIQADLDVVGMTTALRPLVSPELHGSYTHIQALEILLADSGLEYRFSGPQQIAIFVPEVVTPEIVEQPESIPFLEEVIVRATRRPTNLQDTPISVTAFSQAQLDRNLVKDLRDITDIVPGLELTNSGSQSAVLVQLRGVGSTNITEIADGPVAIHVDGVYSPRSQGAAALLYDVEHVEVLRGPQGTLFGRNSSAGSINIYNNMPQLDAFSAALNANLGDFDHRSIRGSVNLPFDDQFALRIAGALDRHDGYTELLDNYVGLGPQYPAIGDQLTDYQQALDVNNQGPEANDQTGVRVTALWQPFDQLRIHTTAERYIDKSTSVVELDPTLVERGQRATVLDSPVFMDLTNDVLRTQVDYLATNGVGFRYLLGVSEMSRSQSFDADFGRDGSFEQQRTHSSEFDFYSHEIQLRSRDNARLTWIVGGYASRERNRIVFAVDQQNTGGNRSPEGATSFISDDPGAAVSFAVQPDRRVDSLGIFAQSIYAINDRSRATLGIRYTEDTKSDRGGRALNCRVTSVLGPYLEPGSIGPGAPDPDQVFADAGASAAIAAGLPYDGGTNEGIGDQPCWARQVNDFKKTWDNTSGLIRYDMDLGKDAMFYASLATGFKSGHIQDAGNSADPETVINYELGLKSQLFENTMRFNLAAYHADYDDLQFSQEDRFDTDGDGIGDQGGSTVVRNASKATIRGLELELEWAMTERDRLQVVGTLMAAEFDDFEIPDTVFGDLFNPFVSPESSSNLDPVDLSGNAPPRTPDWKFTFSYEHDFVFSSLTLTPRARVTFSDEYFLDIYNRTDLEADVFADIPNGGQDLALQDSYHTLDLSLRLTPRSRRWLLEGYISNATDETVKESSGNFVTENGFVAVYSPPRRMGLKLSYRTP